jgi:hypothetical protein
LYEETQSVTPDSNGNFSVKIGAGTPTGNNPGLAFQDIFQNMVMVRSAGTNCASGYTPNANDTRRVVMQVGGTALTPFDLSPVPMASVAQNAMTLQGQLPTDFVHLDPNTSVVLPGYTSASPPASPSAGSIWYNSSTQELQFYDGAASHSLGNEGTANLAGSNTFTSGNQSIQNSSPTQVALTLQGTSGQTANLLEAKDSGGTLLYTLDYSGNPTMATDLVTKDYVDTAYLNTSGGNMYGPVLFSPAGTATNTSLQFMNPGTGFFSPTSNDLAIATTNIERVRITSAGNVGIGTSAPMEALDINGHIAVRGPTPSLGTCGSGATLNANSSDTRGTVTLSGATSTCQITFSQSYSSWAPYCVVSWTGSTLPPTATLAAQTTPSTLTVTFSTSTGSYAFSYICME